MNRISAAFLLYIWISWSSTAIAQATLASLWAEQEPRFSVFQADGQMKRLIVGDNDEPFCVESDFHFERDHDKFFAEFTTRSKSPGVARSLVPDRATIVCDGETIWTCLFLKNHSKGGMIRIYAANSGAAYLSATYHVWLDLREVHGAFFSPRLADAVGKPLQELPKSIVLPKNQGIECVLVLDKRNYPQMTISSYEVRGVSAKTTVKYLFDRSTNLPQYRITTYIENGEVALEEMVRFSRFVCESSGRSFRLADLESPENAQTIDNRPQSQVSRANRNYVPFTPKTPSKSMVEPNE